MKSKAQRNDKLDGNCVHQPHLPINESQLMAVRHTAKGAESLGRPDNFVDDIATVAYLHRAAVRGAGPAVGCDMSRALGSSTGCTQRDGGLRGAVTPHVEVRVYCVLEDFARRL